MNDRPLVARDVAKWESQAIDIRGCAQLEIAVTLYEHERAGLRFETWPDAVRLLVERYLENWMAQHPERAARRVATGIEKRTCILIIHHAPRDTGLRADHGSSHGSGDRAGAGPRLGSRAVALARGCAHVGAALRRARAIAGPARYARRAVTGPCWAPTTWTPATCRPCNRTEAGIDWERSQCQSRTGTTPPDTPQSAGTDPPRPCRDRRIVSNDARRWMATRFGGPGPPGSTRAPSRRRSPRAIPRPGR